jgi:serine protease Do
MTWKRMGAVLTIASAACSCKDRGGFSVSANSAIGAGAAPQSYADVVDHVASGVVTIRSERRLHPPRQFPFADDPFFRQFFNGINGRSPEGTGPVLERSLGSGVIVGGDGYIVTNDHVVDGADQITVEFSERHILPAKLTGSDPPSDLAVLKVDARDLPALPLGDSDKVRVGDVCLAIGNPLGIGKTVTAGIVSAKERSTGVSDGSFEDFLQTDAAINRGNSGGALVNTRAEVIGINSQIVSSSGGNMGIGFAIPSNLTRTVVDQLTHGGKVKRGMLGVGIQSVTPALAAALRLREQRGVLVNSVEPGSPAERAGLHPGDVVIALNGAPVDDPNKFRNQIAALAPGTEVTLTVVRNSRSQELRARLGQLEINTNKETAKATPSGGGQDSGGGELGLSVEPFTPALAAQIGLPRDAHGLIVIGVDPYGPAAEAGIRPMDLIVEVNHARVGSAPELRAALGRSGGGPALLLLERDGQKVFLTLQPAAGG